MNPETAQLSSRQVRTKLKGGMKIPLQSIFLFSGVVQIYALFAYIPAVLNWIVRTYAVPMVCVARHPGRLTHGRQSSCSQDRPQTCLGPLSRSSTLPQSVETGLCTRHVVSTSAGKLASRCQINFLKHYVSLSACGGCSFTTIPCPTRG